MKTRYKLSILFITIIAIVSFGCKKSDIIRPYGSDKTIPKQVLNLSQEGIYGGAIIRYDLPDDKNLSYVKAVYTLSNGKTSEVKASFYTDSLILQGFGETGSYPVKVYSVSTSEVMSEPLTINVQPLTPANQAVIDQLTVIPTYGGIKVDVNNPTKAQLAVSIMKKVSGIWQLVKVEYVKLANYSFYIRGQESIESTYGFIAKDRWENSSEMREVTLTPILEIQCDATKFKAYTLPTDNILYHTSFGVMSALWDNVFEATNRKGLFVTRPGEGMDEDGALWITFDLGLTYKLNRYVWRPRVAANEQYKAGDPKRWEIYGSNAPNPNGSFDSSWTLMGLFENMPPSGEVVATAEDRAYAIKGIDYMFPESLPPFRYIRIKFLENHGGSNIYTMEETYWYGSIAN
ncbi:MAG: DUF4959 domain-containing protein [Bacteroidales bacterium]|jgi:hypothetical protein